MIDRNHVGDLPGRPLRGGSHVPERRSFVAVAHGHEAEHYVGVEIALAVMQIVAKPGRQLQRFFRVSARLLPFGFGLFPIVLRVVRVVSLPLLRYGKTGGVLQALRIR
jgi:hypothetical protein